MKVLLVNPPRFNGIPVIREERCELIERYSILEPYSLLQVASILRKNNYKVQLIDANGFDLSYKELEEKMREIDYDILIFRFTATSFNSDMITPEISKKINKYAKTIGRCFMLENFERSFMMEAKDMDIYIRQEFEKVAPSLINAISEGTKLSEVDGIAYRENGDVKLTNRVIPMSTKEYNALPIPAFDLLPSLGPYFINTPAGKPYTIVHTSKGCPFKCTFCVFVGKTWTMKSPENVIEELRYLKKNYNIKTVSFFDETFTVNRERVIEICHAMIDERMNITWYCNSRVNLLDTELLNIMKDAGCKNISFGIESGSQKVLDNVKKGVTVEQSAKAIKMVKKAGIKTHCSLIFGLPGETWDTVKETIDFLNNVLPNGASFNVAVPYLQSDLYKIAIEKGWIPKDFNWRDINEHESRMRNDDMTAEEIERARLIAYKALYTNPSWYAQNVIHVVKNPGDFWLAVKYVGKILNNYFINDMKYAH